MGPKSFVANSLQPSTTTVLLVDDRKGNLLALAAVLEPLQARLVSVSSGREALKFLINQSDSCALILLDVQMPDLDGFETATLIRQRERTRNTPIIFVTAIAREESNILKGYANGAVDYVVKPFDPDILLAKARVFVEAHQRVQLVKAAATLKLAEAEQRERALNTAAEDAAEQLRTRQRDDMELLSEAIPQLAWIADPDGAIYWFNQRWYEYTGSTLAQMTGWGWTEVQHPDQVAEVTARYKQALAFGQIWEDTSQLRGKDGSYRWFLARAMPVRDSEGEVTRWFGTNTDITEQRKTEFDLLLASRRVTDFIGILSHELRNPLGPIRTSLAILLAEADRSIRHGEAVSVIARQVDHLGRLVDDLLDVTRISHDKIELKRSAVDLAAIGATTAEDYRFLFVSRGIELSIERPGQPIWVNADPLRITQVIGNLLHNAARFTLQGGRVALEVTDTTDPHLIVRDNGIGVEAEHLPELFEPFNQSSRSRTYTQGGLGIGLSVVKSLIELQGGTVRASSGGIGQGFEVTITLPRSPAPAPETAQTRHPWQKRPRSILLIEDNRDAAETLGMFLQMDGHAVRIAFDGEEGVRKAIEQAPEIVICDLGLPLLDGFGVARALRLRSELAGTFLVALSGFAQAHDKEQALAAGFDVHLAKPADLDELQQVVARGFGAAQPVALAS